MLEVARPLRWLQFVVDLALVLVGFGVGYWAKFVVLGSGTIGDYALLTAVFAAAWLVAVGLSGPYGVSRLTDVLGSVGQALRLLALHVLLVTAFVALSKGYDYSREQLLFAYLTSAVLLVLWRMGLIYYIRSRHRQGLGVRRVGLWGWGGTAQALTEFIQQHPEAGLELAVQFAPAERAERLAGLRVQPPTLAAIAQATAELGLEELFVALPGPSEAEMNELIELADRRLLRIRLVPDFGAFGVKGLAIELYDQLPVVTVQSFPLDDWRNRALKRAFDIVFSLGFFLVVGWWLFLMLALLVRLSSPGPVFFRQERSGLNGRRFFIYKFRSMRLNTDAHLRQATADDDRITPIGRFLRRTNLDELPQFWNVLVGQMSVVGPRPHMVKHTEEYRQVIDKYMLRHAVKPGITGLAQARGFRGETPTVWHMQSRVKFDRFYVDNWSFWLDLRIVLATIGAMFRGNTNAV